MRCVVRITAVMGAMIHGLSATGDISLDPFSTRLTAGVGSLTGHEFVA